MELFLSNKALKTIKELPDESVTQIGEYEILKSNKSCSIFRDNQELFELCNKDGKLFKKYYVEMIHGDSIGINGKLCRNHINDETYYHNIYVEQTDTERFELGDGEVFYTVNDSEAKEEVHFKFICIDEENVFYDLDAMRAGISAILFTDTNKIQISLYGEYYDINENNPFLDDELKKIGIHQYYIPRILLTIKHIRRAYEIYSNHLSNKDKFLNIGNEVNTYLESVYNQKHGHKVTASKSKYSATNDKSKE